MSLKRQVLSGLFWVSLAQMLGRGLSTVTTLILAYKLGPEALGLVGAATLAINAFQFLQDIGFDAALVYRRGDVDDASHTAFFVVIVSSALICLVAALTAPWAASLLRQPIVPIVRVMALTMLISGLGRVPYILLSRDLSFQRKVFPELAANTIGSLTSIILAFAGVGLWSIVWGEIVRTALTSALVWFVTAWRPRLRFSMQIARELFGYGKHIVLSQTLIFLITNVDNAIVSRYAGSNALGQYQFAYNLSNRPATQITSVLSQVMFPTFAKLAGGDAGQTRARYYLTTIRFVAWVTVPIAAATILFAPEFILGLYGEPWAAAILPLQMLAIYGLIRSIAANMGSIFRALGKPQWLTYIAAWRLTTMLLTLYPVVTRWGINGVSVLSVIVAVVDFCISATLIGRLVKAPWRAYARIVLPAALAALGGGLAAHALYPYLPLPRTALNLAAAGVILVAVYGGLIWLLDGEFRTTVRRYGSRLVQMWRERQAQS